MSEIKFLSLLKPELEYEVEVRGETPGLTVALLRKQISKLGPKFPSCDILLSHLETGDDLDGLEASLARLEESVNQLSANYEKNKLERSRNLALQIYFRITRIDASSSREDSVRLSQATIKLKTLQASLAVPSLGEITSETPVTATGNIELVSTNNDVTVPQVIVSCDKNLSGDLTSLKYDGKTCARAFIQRVKEFITARNISSDKMLRFATEIFTGDALHWFRSLQDSVSTWDEVCDRLKEDFSQSDYDYRFLEEIRARTQGERENITIYLAIMSGMFSQLNKPLSDADKLEIILHNIRPTYASVLTSVSKIENIEELRILAKNYEDVQARMSRFSEPPKIGPSTLAPSFAYAHSSDSRQVYPGSRQYQQFQPNYRSFNQNRPAPVTSKPVHAVEKQKFCPRCREDTHSLRQCKAERKIVCFRCGRPDFRHYDCPDCQGSAPSHQSKN